MNITRKRGSRPIRGNITLLELRVLRSLLTNWYDTGVWSTCINDSYEPSGVEGTQLSGVVASLVKKGLVNHIDPNTKDSYLELTELGRAAAENATASADFNLWKASRVSK